MQITSSLPITTESTRSLTSGGTFSPEDYLTAADLKMLEYVTGTANLSAAEGDSYAKTLAESIGSQREQGKLTGDAASIYMPSQLTASDANVVEKLTGASNIIDAAHTSNTSVANLVQQIAADRQSGNLKGDLTVSYFRTTARYDLNRLLFHHFKGISVSFGTVFSSIKYLQSSAYSAYEAASHPTE
ncbi:hypothetical protein [Granulicella aggregans]|nr:hypothetical protein [Granulicella aggregans]